MAESKDREAQEQAARKDRQTEDRHEKKSVEEQLVEQRTGSEGGKSAYDLWLEEQQAKPHILIADSNEDVHTFVGPFENYQAAEEARIQAVSASQGGHEFRSVVLTPADEYFDVAAPQNQAAQEQKDAEIEEYRRQIAGGYTPNQPQPVIDTRSKDEKQEQKDKEVERAQESRKIEAAQKR